MSTNLEILSKFCYIGSAGLFMIWWFDLFPVAVFLKKISIYFMPENHRSIVGCWENLKIILLEWAFIAWKTNQCAKNVQIRRFFWFEYRKIRTRKNSVFGLFPTVNGISNLKNFSKFTGKHLCQSLFIKKETLAHFPMNFAKFLRTFFL